MFGFHQELGIVSMQRRSAQKPPECTRAVCLSFRFGAGSAPRRSGVRAASPVVKLFHSMHGDGETRADGMMGTLQVN